MLLEEMGRFLRWWFDLVGGKLLLVQEEGDLHSWNMEMSVSLFRCWSMFCNVKVLGGVIEVDEEYLAIIGDKIENGKVV